MYYLCSDSSVLPLRIHITKRAEVNGEADKIGGLALTSERIAK